MTSASDLFAVQEIDLQRDARIAIVADIESRIGETDELLDCRETVEDSQAALDRLRKRQREFEGQLQDLDAKINPLETKLYDGSIRNPKELTDLQREFESLKAKRSQLDEQGISLMESVDAATRALEAARTEASRIEAEWNTDQDNLKASKTKTETELAGLDQQRSVRTTGMDVGALGLYERLRSTKQGRGVSRVERGVCHGCRVTLPTHLSQRLRTGRELIQCPRCERILVAG